ncbi:BaiN/RdsA family NAD(P)/FAD-dependent oxidoreductase [Tabrizicola oligotrophica]|uniref:NAD(P)/FAD-dependent oxidoreductase n=1 Tax=Tabrizicola oligotrophica TaxID=2710650 RepID=A0A6M0QPK9_9RHOB|nr:NAD(P)/FAD-dependent oxidoreductase [Tabrizicola oligotrophica]NEY89071.1 NAD(P)/FAD-dependent oxidoreductase [Tabrizicola oligotrophica]
MKQMDVIVLGAGAAGLMAGIEAARRGRRVVVIDHAARAGEKIRISGGGRCNFTNLGIAADRFLSKNPRFALSALKRFTQWDIIGRLDAAGIGWHEKTLGQLFCDGSAREVVALLTGDLERAGAELWLSCPVGAVRRAGSGFAVETARGGLQAGAVIVATGGKSIPKMGATGFGYQLAESFGLPLVETRPALVPLTFAEQELQWMAPLAGVSVQGRASCGKTSFDEAVLFTHRGLSGPAILQISSYWREGQAISLNLCPGVDVAAALRAGKQENARALLRSHLARLVPEKLARQIEADLGLEAPLGTLSNAALERVAAQMREWSLMPVGSEGYRTAEVTLGGVDTAALDARTMEAKGVPGLYFIGEVVDVTGWLGGYNFQWAWSSGWAAGQVA